MDVSEILNKILSEQTSDQVTRTAKGINYKDTYQVLNNVKNSKSDTCNSLKSLGEIKQMTPNYPTDGKISLMSKFPELVSMNVDEVAYATSKIDDQTVVVFRS